MPGLSVIVALNNIRSAHNVGALFRTSAAVGVQELWLGGLTPTPPRAEIAKTALGGVDVVPWKAVPNLAIALAAHKKAGWHILALEQHPTATTIFNTSLPDHCILVLGNEREGVEENILALADSVIELPMPGRGIQSLNVATSGGIALYEVMRQLCYNK